MKEYRVTYRANAELAITVEAESKDEAKAVADARREHPSLEETGQHPQWVWSVHTVDVESK